MVPWTASKSINVIVLDPFTIADGRMNGRHDNAMKKAAGIVFIVLFALAGGVFYGVIADKLFKGREPWFTVFMLLGLALSVGIMTWLSGASHTLSAWVFVITGILYMVARMAFGKGSALEMFFAPHVIALMILLLQPASERAHEKAGLLREQQHSAPPEHLTQVGAVKAK
jgi:MFS family permease